MRGGALVEGLPEDAGPGGLMPKLSTTMTIYVDESGTASFGEQAGRSDGRGYVIAAVAVPALSAPTIHSLLPRDAHGKLLKFSDAALSFGQLERFVAEILATDVQVCLVLLDTASPENAENFRELAELSNRRRVERGNPPIAASSLTYMLAHKEALLGVLQKATAAIPSVARFFDVVLDEANLQLHDRRLAADAFSMQLARAGLVCQSYRWAKEQDEPLLYVPDLLAGIYRRSATLDDVPGALALLERAEERGRVVLQDGMQTMDPTAELAARREADNPRG
jgi:hypothetical protein